MKNLIKLLILVSVLQACQQKAAKEETTETAVAADTTESSSWKEMDDFHLIMAESFHPYKDSANLEPAKREAGKLASLAATWKQSAFPAKVNTDEVKARVDTLNLLTSRFATTVTSGDDKAIAGELTAIHDLFHKIQETWYGPGEKEHEHHH